ncbi:virulence-associated protein [Pseudovibrio denitrificans]|uniref:Virulence-associated protein n=1 Tax=Pseudovibrio denitrificans TaxID=258256 RepID=A0A1I7DV78_9HYPH|nr:hypothetical protein [Pseudovibrio denitrificans]SFU15580.1 virulence-associated protein [Pseudovibrio denitrificans]
MAPPKKDNDPNGNNNNDQVHNADYADWEFQMEEVLHLPHDEQPGNNQLSVDYSPQIKALRDKFMAYEKRRNIFKDSEKQKEFDDVLKQANGFLNHAEEQNAGHNEVGTQSALNGLNQTLDKVKTIYSCGVETACNLLHCKEELAEQRARAQELEKVDPKKLKGLKKDELKLRGDEFARLTKTIKEKGDESELLLSGFKVKEASKTLEQMAAYIGALEAILLLKPTAEIEKKDKKTVLRAYTGKHSVADSNSIYMDIYKLETERDEDLKQNHPTAMQAVHLQEMKIETGKRCKHVKEIPETIQRLEKKFEGIEDVQGKINQLKKELKTTKSIEIYEELDDRLKDLRLLRDLPVLQKCQEELAKLEEDNEDLKEKLELMRECRDNHKQRIEAKKVKLSSDTHQIQRHSRLPTFVGFDRLDADGNPILTEDSGYTYHGNKIHLSIRQDQVEKAGDILTPLLLSPDCPFLSFKVSNLQATQTARQIISKRLDDSPSEEKRKQLEIDKKAQQRISDGAQITLYPYTKDEDFTGGVQEYNFFIKLLEQELEAAGIQPGDIPKSDVGLEGMKFATFRHEDGSRGEEFGDKPLGKENDDLLKSKPFYKALTGQDNRQQIN